MEFNIALNSIFYISIFIIPGIILRRFYFSGEFNKEFSQGNLLERFMWIIFCSIVALATSALFFFTIKNIFDKELLSEISYNTIIEIFSLLDSNKLPEEKRFEEIYFDFSVLILCIYFLSFMIGIWARRAVTYFGMADILPVFKFKNYWYYFVRGKIKNSSRVKGSTYWYTDSDILVNDGNDTKLYTGKISDYYIDNTSNQLECIFLEDAKRYKWVNDNKTKYKLIEIPGDLFCIPNSRIVNINLSYVYRQKDVSSLKKLFWTIVQILYFSAVLLLIPFFFIDNLGGINIDSIFLKFFFCLTSWTILSVIRSIFKKVIFPEIMLDQDFSMLILGFLCASFQFLWIFELFKWWHILLFTLFFLIIYVGVFIPTNKEDDDVKVEEIENDSEIDPEIISEENIFNSNDEDVDE